MLRVIGHGKFSQVFLGRHKEDLSEVAIKVIEKNLLSEEEQSYLGTELAIIKVI